MVHALETFDGREYKSWSLIEISHITKRGPEPVWSHTIYTIYGDLWIVFQRNMLCNANAESMLSSAVQNCTYFLSLAQEFWTHKL